MAPRMNTMRTVTTEKTLTAPPAALWAVMADFPSISSWNNAVKNSYATSDATSGVGARRHNDLSPIGTAEETITGWEPEQEIVISLDSTTRAPVNSGVLTMTFDENDNGVSTRIHYVYNPKPILGKLAGPLLDRVLTKGLNGFLDDLDKAANSTSPS
jgi:uncharacterized protein YndB with AHSA1/START domain